MVDRPTIAAAGFVAATAWGAAVSVRADVPGEPFGKRAPGTVPVQLAAGLGSGLSAPWPMAAAVVLAARAGSRSSRRVSAVIGTLAIAGMLAEPVTWGRRRRSGAVTSTIALNALAAGALVAAGTGRRPPRRQRQTRRSSHRHEDLVAR